MWRVRPRGSREGPTSSEGGAKPRLETAGTAVQENKSKETEKIIMGSKPTHEQAQLHLQVYDQRREAKLRQARDWFFKSYHVEPVEDAILIASSTVST